MKDKRNKRHVGRSGRRLTGFLAGLRRRITRYVALRGELPRSTHFFWEAGFSNKLFTGNRVP